MESNTNLNKLISIINDIEFVDEPKISFPQADNFNRLISICEFLSKKNLSKEDIATLNEFTSRQSNYYINAGIYLNLIEKYNYDLNIKFRLTDKGKYIFNLNNVDRNLELAKCILEHTVFFHVFEDYLNTMEMPSKDRIVEIMKQHQLYNIKSDATFKRRSLTVNSWIKWIIDIYL